MNKDLAFILGNGQTRLQVNCKGLLDRGAVYGCNRIYEEFSPTVLVSTDKGMAHEIQHTGYSSTNVHYVREQWKIENSGANILPKEYTGMSSGPAALGLASDTCANYFFLIGMDLKGINNTINNIYAGTKNYKHKGDSPIYFGNWVDQIIGIIQKYPTKRFMHVNPLDNFTDDKFLKFENFETITLAEFNGMINNTS